MSERTGTTSHNPVPTGNRILRLDEVRERVGLSRTHVYDLIAAKRFPAQLKLIPGGRSSGWLESEIDTWIAERVAERDASHAAQMK